MKPSIVSSESRHEPRRPRTDQTGDHPAPKNPPSRWDGVKGTSADTLARSSPDGRLPSVTACQAPALRCNDSNSVRSWYTYRPIPVTVVSRSRKNSQVPVRSRGKPCGTVRAAVARKPRPTHFGGGSHAERFAPLRRSNACGQSTAIGAGRKRIRAHATPLRRARGRLGYSAGPNYRSPGYNGWFKYAVRWFTPGFSSIVCRPEEWALKIAGGSASVR